MSSQQNISAKVSTNEDSKLPHYRIRRASQIRETELEKMLKEIDAEVEEDFAKHPKFTNLPKLNLKPLDDSFISELKKFRS